MFWQRAGSELVVLGKDCKIAYGPVSVTVDADSNGWEGYKHLIEESVNAETTTTIFLDDMKALDYGMAFRILGNVVYAAEQVG